jgi:hypothetical protein
MRSDHDDLQTKLAGVLLLQRYARPWGLRPVSRLIARRTTPRACLAESWGERLRAGIHRVDARLGSGILTLYTCDAYRHAGSPAGHVAASPAIFTPENWT